MGTNKNDVHLRRQAGTTDYDRQQHNHTRRPTHTHTSTKSHTDQHQRWRVLLALQRGNHEWHQTRTTWTITCINTRITTLVTNCKFQDQQTTETMKIMLLQHAIRYHKANDWIHLQDPATLTYKSLLNHCKLLEQCCKQFQKAQLKGRAELTSLTATSVTHTSVYQDSISMHPKQTSCYRCGYSHINRDCPAIGQRCHKCNGMNHFSALCRTWNYRDYRDYDRKSRYSDDRQSRHSWREPHKSRDSSRSSSHDSSRSNSRGRPSKSNKHHKSPQHSSRYRRSPTPFQIHSMTTAVQEPTEASDTDSEDKPVSKCKNRCPTPLPSKLFNFSDLDSSTCDELSLSKMGAGTNYTLHPEDADFLPSQDNTSHLPRPSCIIEVSDTEDQGSTTYNELLASDTELDTNYTLQPEDTNFSPFQDHVIHILRPPPQSKTNKTTPMTTYQPK